jgi:hypothetical protein
MRTRGGSSPTLTGWASVSRPTGTCRSGWVAHYYPGVALARLEGQMALAALLRRAPGFRLAVVLLCFSHEVLSDPPLVVALQQQVDKNGFQFAW